MPEGEVLDLPSELSSANRSPTAVFDGIMPGMAEVATRKLDETKRVFGETESRMESDRGRMTAAMEASGLEAEKLKPWNYEEESRKRTVDPLESFGSLGSVFGILASAFTRAPMENALNASAAAMNAVKAANEEDYKKAYTAWKDNMALVEKRHAMIQAQFNNALALFRTDMAAGTVKAQNIATRYGDEQALFLLNNGMNKEFFDLLSQRNKAMADMSEAAAKIDRNTFAKKQFEAAIKDIPPEEQEKNPAKIMAMWNYYHGMNTKEEENFMVQYWSEHPGASFDDAAKAAAKHKADQHAAATISTPDRMDAKEIERRRDQYVQEGMRPNDAYDKAASEVRKIASANKLNVDRAFMEKYYEAHPDATTEEFSKAFAEFKKTQKPPGTTGGNTNLTGDRQRAQDVAAYREKLKTSTDPETGELYTGEKVGELAAKYEAKLKATATPVTGNQRDTLRSMIDRTVNFEQTVDKIEGLLAKHNALTGIGGKVTRPAEAISNVFGGNETDRAQFARYHAELKEWAARILNESKGRPLAAEAAQVDRIVAGMNAGDTTANTVRAYRELRPLIQKIREDLKKRESGTWTPPATGGPPAEGATKPKWMDAPVIGPRSDVGVDADLATV